MDTNEFIRLKRRIQDRYDRDIAALVCVWSLDHPNEQPPETAAVAVAKDVPHPAVSAKKHAAGHTKTVGHKIIATAMQDAFEAVSDTFTWKDLSVAAEQSGVELKKSTLSQFLRRKADSGCAVVASEGSGRRATTYKKVSATRLHHGEEMK